LPAAAATLPTKEKADEAAYLDCRIVNNWFARRRRSKRPVDDASRAKSARRRAGENAVQHALRHADLIGEGASGGAGRSRRSQQARLAVERRGRRFRRQSRHLRAHGRRQIGSIAISEHKARAAAKYRRPTKVFEEFMQQGRSYIGTLDDVIASRGGIPLVEDNKIIGAIGCSGATGSQDEVVCMAGAATIK
jgi:hypothetical protein